MPTGQATAWLKMKESTLLLSKDIKRSYDVKFKNILSIQSYYIEKQTLLSSDYEI